MVNCEHSFDECIPEISQDLCQSLSVDKWLVVIDLELKKVEKSYICGPFSSASWVRAHEEHMDMGTHVRLTKHI